MKKKAILAAVALIVVIVGAIFFSLSRDNSGSDQQAISANVTTTDQAPLSDPKPEPKKYDPSENGKHLVIKEWNVRFKLKPAVKDALLIRHEDTKKPWGLTTQTVIDKSAYCGGKDAAIFINRAKQGEEIMINTTVDEILKDDPNGLQKIDQYYYVIFSTGAACFDQADSQLENKIVRELVSSFKTLEKVPRIGGNY